MRTRKRESREEESEEYNLINNTSHLLSHDIYSTQMLSVVVGQCGLEKEKSDGSALRGLISTRVHKAEQTNKASQKR